MLIRKFSPALVLASLTTLVACSGDSQPEMMTPPPTPVGVVELVEQELSLTTELPGRTQAYRVAEIRPRINGIIEQRLFAEGAEVSAGEVLYQIEDNTYAAAVAAARATVQQAEAAAELAELQHNRLQPLAAAERVSRQDFDAASATLAQAQASLAAAEAQLQTTQINLDYTRVVSPISGRVGKSAFTEGALVTALQADPLTQVVQLDPIYVEVSQSADELLALRRQAGELGMSQSTGLPVHLILEDGSTYAHAGELEFTEVNVDVTTGTLNLRAVFPNPDQLLLPGMFVRAELTQLVLENALLLPQQAVMRDPSGAATVWVVGANDMVEARQVEISRAVDDRWLIQSGLASGDRVIVDSLQKIQPGMPVSPVPTELNQVPEQ